VNPKEFVANLLAEVKLAEKRLAKAQERLAPLADRIKAALRAGDRATAEKLAVTFEQAKDDVTRAEQDVATAKTTFEEGKKRGAQAERDQKTLRTAQALGGALGAVNKAMDTAKAADDMLAKLSEDTAMAEARLHVLLDDAESKLPPELRSAPGGKPAAPPPPPVSTAEDILKEFE
jgi:phage shock protein A